MPTNLDKGIYDRSLNKTRGSTTPLSSFSLLFSEIIQYAAINVKGVQAMESRLALLGYKLGIAHPNLTTLGSRMIEVTVWRDKTSKREHKILGPTLLP
jgi:hypothetical protein